MVPLFKALCNICMDSIDLQDMEPKARAQQKSSPPVGWGRFSFLSIGPRLVVHTAAEILLVGILGLGSLGYGELGCLLPDVIECFLHPQAGAVEESVLISTLANADGVVKCDIAHIPAVSSCTAFHMCPPPEVLPVTLRMV